MSEPAFAICRTGQAHHSLDPLVNRSRVGGHAASPTGANGPDSLWINFRAQTHESDGVSQVLGPLGADQHPASGRTAEAAPAKIKAQDYVSCILKLLGHKAMLARLVSIVGHPVAHDHGRAFLAGYVVMWNMEHAGNPASPTVKLDFFLHVSNSLDEPILVHGALPFPFSPIKLPLT